MDKRMLLTMFAEFEWVQRQRFEIIAQEVNRINGVVEQLQADNAQFKMVIKHHLQHLQLKAMAAKPVRRVA